MTTDEIAETLDVASLTHQLAVSAAYEELRTLPRDDPRAKQLRQSLNISYGRFATVPRGYPDMDLSALTVTPEVLEADKALTRFETAMAPFIDEPAQCTFPRLHCDCTDCTTRRDAAMDAALAINWQTHAKVIPLPVKQATRWTTIKHLDGSMLATTHGFGVSGAWGWIVDTVAAEHGISEHDAEDRISSREGEEDQYDGDDLVTVDGVPMYRIEHTTAPFSK